ncbi:hypothetical protein BDN67DRAFT_971949 [Paxillus ammoniavirescens]|nr:hypothetical protein BDN67DRAFT_971949 [Paxillus ammoniavirescens]
MSFWVSYVAHHSSTRLLKSMFLFLCPVYCPVGVMHIGRSRRRTSSLLKQLAERFVGY